MQADPARLRQVFSNLLINAAKYTEPGGQLCLEAERQGNLVAVHVKDNGIGMSADFLGRAFDMFIQGEHSEGGGLGIGLTLVKNLVELHGGSVEAHSDGANRGSEFIVRLPLVSDAQLPADNAMPAAPARTQGGKRILVVDDNSIQATSLSMLMQYSGHDVKTALDGPSALAVLADFVPDVALIDIGLGGTMSGLDLARQMRAQQRFDKTVLIAQTGWGRNEDRERSRAAGFDHHVVKPIDHNRLQRIIAGEKPL